MPVDRHAHQRIAAIDGLRGVSVLGVLGFHLAPNGVVRGGYLGVSVFFALSGFLITRNLVAESQRRHAVDLARFWSRRIRRLSPAAFFVVIACWIAHKAGLQWVVFDFGRQAFAAAIGASNWQIIHDIRQIGFLGTLGPFGAMWSLAIEEQFYVVAALLCWACARSKYFVTILTVALGVTVMWSAFAVAIFGRHLGDYYRTDLRAGEIALGGLYAVWSTRASRSAAESGAGSTVGSRLLVNGGLAGIVALFVTVRRDYWLLQPVVLLIAATLGVVIVHGLLGASSSELLAKGGTHGGLLASRPVQFVGLISYSLYLVHWPIIQAVTPARLGLGMGATQAVCAGTSIVVAWLVYRFVEAPLRRSHGPARNVFAMWAACLIVMLGLFAI